MKGWISEVAAGLADPVTTSVLLGIVIALLAMTMVLLFALFLRSRADARRARDAVCDLEAVLVAAMERNQHEDSTTLAVQINAVRSDLLAVSDAIRREHNAQAMNNAEQLRDVQQAQSVRDREMLQTMATLRSELARELLAVKSSVAEKLEGTLSARLSESFQTVESQLAAVHRGLGEMRELASNVDGLRRVLTNVKSRGTFGEVQLSMILSDILTPEQYLTNVATRPRSSERVEFAVKLPGKGEAGAVLLPIDAKFPLEDYERILAASDVADAEGVKTALKGLEARLVLEARKIREKYVEVPYTTEFAVLYLPLESLWAEVLKIPGLTERLQREQHVTVAGPAVMAALLNSLQMGFRTLAIEEKSAEVWRLLAVVKTEFERFAEAVGKVEKRIEGVTGDLSQLRTRTNVMNRRLRDLNPEDVLGGEKAASETSNLN